MQLRLAQIVTPAKVRAMNDVAQHALVGFDPLYLQHDYKRSRAKGGLNHISHWMLLDGPGNRIESDKLALNGLRAENRGRGRMATKVT